MSVWGAAIIGGVSLWSANKENKRSKKESNEALEYQKEQDEKLEIQKQEYREIELRNPYEGVQNAFSGLQTDFGNLASDAKNMYSGLENKYEGMENRFEDMTVDRRAADFQSQQGQQQRANIMGGLRGAAGGSGIAGLAQSLANQGQLQAQQISAGIGQQERQNKLASAAEGSRIDQLQRGTSMQLQQMQAQGAMQIQGMQIAGASQARGLGVARESQIAEGEWKRDMMERGGDAMLQEAEMSRHATLLGMSYGASSGANDTVNQTMQNEQYSSNAVDTALISGLGNIDWSKFSGGTTNTNK